MPEVLLFDLDGTLVDTAPTLIGIVNAMLLERRLPLLPLAQARNLVSQGARPLIVRGFGARHTTEEEEPLMQRFLELYEQSTHQESSIFIQLEKFIHTESQYRAYGIVTNKPTRLTEQLLAQLSFPVKPACVVCGDTLTKKKPDPAPLLHAAAILGVDPRECVYVGDDQRDVVAGQSAGMPTVVAGWGYIPPGTVVGEWGANAVADHPSRLYTALEIIMENRIDPRTMP